MCIVQTTAFNDWYDEFCRESKFPAEAVRDSAGENLSDMLTSIRGSVISQGQEMFIFPCCVN